RGLLRAGRLGGVAELLHGGLERVDVGLAVVIGDDHGALVGVGRRRLHALDVLERRLGLATAATAVPAGHVQGRRRLFGQRQGRNRHQASQDRALHDFLERHGVTSRKEGNARRGGGGAQGRKWPGAWARVGDYSATTVAAAFRAAPGGPAAGAP